MSDTPMQEFWVARDVDRLGEYLGNSTSDFFFKVSTEDSHGSLLVIELTNQAKGGVPRHIHYEQDEWFYVVEGEYIIEVGRERFRIWAPQSAARLGIRGRWTWKALRYHYTSRSARGVFPGHSQGARASAAGSGPLSCLRI